jgi:electron transfer flavoprotein alpha subunit
MHLLLAHTEADGTLAKSALEALAAGIQLAESLGVPFSIGLIGDNPGPAADSIATCGATRVLTISGPEFAQARYATDAAAAEALCRAAAATVVTVPATSRWNRVLPGVAHRLGGRADTHITAITAANGQPQVSRWFYRQRMEAVFTRATRPWLIALEGGIATVAALSNRQAQNPAPIENISLTATAARTEVIGFAAPASDQQTIRPDAELLFVTGAGWTKKQADGQVKLAEAESLILDFLRLTRSSLGSTKSLVDLGGEGQSVLPFLSHLNQVGQTGSTPRHAKGLATCCHGEEPHTVGWRFINERRAITLDANCGWARGKADILYVADAFAVIARINTLLAP